jgi:hypothetical protein
MATFIPTDEISGEVSSTEIAFGAADGSLTSSEKLTWDDTKLHVQSTALSSVLQKLESTANPTSADFSVKMELEASGTPTVDGAGIAAIDFRGKDSAGNDTHWARMGVVAADRDAGTEDAVVKFDMVHAASENVEHLSMGNGKVTINNDNRNVSFLVKGQSTAVIQTVAGSNTFQVNPFGNSAVNMQVSGSGGDSNLLFTNAGQNNVGIGTNPDSTVERLHIQGDGNVDLVKLETTDDTSSTGPDLVLYRNSQSPAPNDFIGRLDFRGKDNADSDVDYAIIATKLQDVGTGTGKIVFFANDGSGVNLNNAQLDIQPGDVVVNEAGRNIDFRVETMQSANAFLVDGDTGDITMNAQVGIGTGPDSGVEGLHVSGSGTQTTLVKFESTDTDSEVGPVLDMVRNPGQAGVAGDRLGYIRFKGPNSNGDVHHYADILCKVHDATAGSEDASLEMDVIRDGTSRTNLRIRHSEVIINEDSADVDFRVESDSNTHMLQVDAGQNKVAVGGAAVGANVATFQVPDGTISRYCNIIPLSGTSTVLDNNTLQGHTHVLQSSVNHTITLPETPVKGQWFRFLSTGGNITVDPTSGVSINGGTAGSTVTRSIDNQLYTMICLGSSDWVVNNP